MNRWWLMLMLCATTALPGCLTMKGAVPLTPQLTQDTKTLWIFLDTNKDRSDGVYRCIDAANGPVCMKAELRN